MNAALAAHGGLAAVSQIMDTTAAGQVRIYRADGTYEQHTYTIKTRAFDQLRTEVDGTELYISNARAGWVLRKREKQRLPTHEVANAILPLSNWARRSRNRRRNWRPDLNYRYQGV